MTEIIPNCQEVLYYDAIYAFALKDSSEALSGKSAVSFLMKSNLGMEEIKKVILGYGVDYRFGLRL